MVDSSIKINLKRVNLQARYTLGGKDATEDV